MNKHVDLNISAFLNQGLEDIAEVFPKSLSRVVLVRLDRCARESNLPPVFALQNNLDEARRALGVYLATPAFQKAFVNNFSSEIPALLRKVDGDSDDDDESDDPHDDFLSAISGMKKQLN